MSVLLETSLGEIVVDLDVENCPETSRNFLNLCKLKAYNYARIFNVQHGYMAQCGTNRTQNYEGNYSKSEPSIEFSRAGLIAMVVVNYNKEKKQGDYGSHFLITLGSALTLQQKAAVFGVVAEGMEVVKKINDLYVDQNGTPYQDILLKHTEILHDPFEDVIECESPPPPDWVLESTKLQVNEQIEYNDEELQKMLKEETAKGNALALEILGDLPYAEIKPPENVLFVCKLNSVTKEEDLKTIFLRFGEVTSCEVVRDRKTGQSLCYAFVEFEDKESCEAAYFKMNNVLIDERRIKVDFSQSVSRLHCDWINSRRRRAAGGFGGFDNLARRKRYRDEVEDDEEKYPFLFKHQLKNHKFLET